MRISGLLIALFGVVGCATAPGSYTVENSALIEKTYDESWRLLVDYFTHNSITIKAIEKGSGVLVGEAQINQIHDRDALVNLNNILVADCGKPGTLRPIRQVVRLHMLMRADGRGYTRLTVNVTAFETRRFTTILTSQDEIVACNSTGKLEADITDYLRQ